MTTYFTSDTHFNHLNIIRYSNRPFLKADGQSDVPAMNRALIEGWNSVVGKGDLVWHLGDFGMGNWREWAQFRRRLNGKLFLIKGNHDRKVNEWMLPGDEVFENALRETPYGLAFLTHVPPAYEDQPRYAHDKTEVHPVPPEASFVLCGHVHEKWERKLYKGKVVINCGVDVQGYQPKTLGELDVARMP